MADAGGMKKKRILVVLIVLIAMVGLSWALGWLGGKKLKKVETAKVKKREIVEKVTASGKLKPEKEVKITADVSGEIINLPVKEGKKVKQGALLVEIKPDVYEAAVERRTASLNNAKANLANAKAQLNQAKVRLKNAKKAYKRNKKLFEKEAISESEFEKVKAEYRTKKAQVKAARQTVEASRFNVESARANLREARDKLDKTEIYSPAKGTISSLSVEEGERVVGTQQMEGTEILRVSDLQSMQMHVEVNENDIINIREGDTAEIEIDAFVDRTFQGVVSHVANSAKQQAQTSTSSDQITNFEVEVDILRSSYEDIVDNTRKVATPFRPGMSGMVRIKTDKVSNAVSVPILAVTTRQLTNEKNKDGNSPLSEVVFLFQDGRAIRQKVKTGIQDNYFIQIKKGVNVGQKVISGPYSAVSKTIKDSTRVRQKPDKKAP